jgi:hypothetical protein
MNGEPESARVLAFPPSHLHGRAYRVTQCYIRAKGKSKEAVYRRAMQSVWNAYAKSGFDDSELDALVKDFHGLCCLCYQETTLFQAERESRESPGPDKGAA